MSPEVDPVRSFQVRQSNLAEIQWRESRGDDALTDGQVDVAIRRFAFTANNVTYARLGGPIPTLGFGYWDFFPGDADWGCIPVWGLAEVVAYFSIAADDPAAIINDTARQTLTWIDENGMRRQATLPTVIFSRPAIAVTGIA